MQRCLELAQQGLGSVAPNPQVGALIVKNGRIIGEGFHAQFGAAHAEVNAIESVQDKSQIEGATLYVTLEPCVHEGKTPPCCQRIQALAFREVIIGTADPNPQVNGKGIAFLKQAGIAVVTGILEKQSTELIKRFATYHQKERPYIILKWAQTLDGYMDRVRAENEPRINWITGKETKRLTHLWRSQEQAILVGATTVINDNPQLTVREISGRNPMRIVLDPGLRTDAGALVYSDNATTLVFNFSKNEENGNVHYIQINAHKHFLEQVLEALYQRQILSLLVEGGKTTLASFIDAGLWDEARVLVGPVTFGFGLEAPQMLESHASQEQFDNDQILHYYNDKA